MNLKREFSFKSKYKESLKYLVDSLNFIGFMAILIIFSFIIGILFPIFFKEQIISFFLSLENQITNLNPLELILFILQNNRLSIGAVFALLGHTKNYEVVLEWKL